MYVWVDALLGYLTALGPARASHWDAAAERTHVIGKGITRFHAVYWLGILLAVGLELPTHILVQQLRGHHLHRQPSSLGHLSTHHLDEVVQQQTEAQLEGTGLLVAP